jgi:hypothetical protein
MFLCKGLVATLAVLAVPAFGLAQGSGYVWANNPTVSSYTPNPAYSYNSPGGAITINRSSVGVYAVRFSGLGESGKPGGNVQVTAYGSGSESCKVVSWNSGGADFIVNVRCFNTAGNLVNSRYTVLVTLPATQEQAPTPSPTLQLTTLPDGTIEKRSPDGSREHLLPSGERVLILPDGRKLRVTKMATRVAVPPVLPDEAGGKWLDVHSESLLQIIGFLFADDEKFEIYNQSAGDELNVYDRIKKRTQVIHYILRR